METADSQRYSRAMSCAVGGMQPERRSPDQQLRGAEAQLISSRFRVPSGELRDLHGLAIVDSGERCWSRSHASSGSTQESFTADRPGVRREVTRGGAWIITNNPFGHDGRPVAAFPRSMMTLQVAWMLSPCQQSSQARARARISRPGRHRRHEPHAVQSVVEVHAAVAVDRDCIAHQGAEQRQRQESVSNRRAPKGVLVRARPESTSIH